MDQSFSHQETSIEKQHPKPNPDNFPQPKSFNTSDYDVSVSKSNPKFHKPFSATQVHSNDPPTTQGRSQHSNSENSTEYQAIKQGTKAKNELDAVPEISVEYSQLTTRTNQPEEMYKGRPEYDNEDRNITKSKRNLAKVLYDYQPHSINTSKSLDFKMDSGIQNSLGKQFISPTHQMATEDNQASKYRDNKEKGLSREPFLTSKHSITTAYEKTDNIDKDPHAHKSSYSDINLVLLRRPDSSSKLSKSDFQSRNFREAFHQGQESNEIRRLKDENEKLTEIIKARERELQDNKRFNDELYKKYREVQAELGNSQKEKENFFALKTKLSQLEGRESAVKRETEEVRQNDAQKNKLLRELQANVTSLKADITFLTQKNEAKVEALRLEIQRLEDDNSRLVQSKRHSETKRDTIIHHLEMSHDEEKFSLRKNLQESVSQLQLATNKNNELTQKIERLSKQSRRREKEYLERMDESAYENKRAFEENILQIKEEIRQQYQSKIYSLQAKVDKLSTENENLALELQSKPPLRRFKEYEARIHTLEAELETVREHTQEHRKKPSDIGIPAKILKELIDELEVENVGEIIPKIKEIQQEQKTDSKLVQSLLDLVQKCSPKGSFERRPTHKQAWNWIKQIMEEYMTLKRQEEGVGSGAKRDILKTVMDFLNVKDKSEVPGKLSQILGDNIGMNKVLAKVKILHKLDWVNSLHELEQRIQSEINATSEDPYLRSSYYKRANS